LNNNYSFLIDLVINQHLYPKIPKYVEDWIHEQLNMCWQSDPIAKPSIEEVLDSFLGNLAKLKNYEEFAKEKFGQKFRK
jgi:hypothetical protein